jgi:hypothetical protein
MSLNEQRDDTLTPVRFWHLLVDMLNLYRQKEAVHTELMYGVLVPNTLAVAGLGEQLSP